MCKRSVDIWGHLYHVLSVNSLIFGVDPLEDISEHHKSVQNERERGREGGGVKTARMSD